MKIEINNTVDENISFKTIVKEEKQDFLEIIKKLKVAQEKKFNIYTIAGKIARGESVSSEELAYIRQMAPSLLATAMQQNAEREKDLRGENNKSKEVKHSYLVNKVKDNSENVDKNSSKTNGDLMKVEGDNLIPKPLDKINIG